jgi:hypothetical protein
MQSGVSWSNMGPCLVVELGYLFVDYAEEEAAKDGEVIDKPSSEVETIQIYAAIRGRCSLAVLES